jgi:hydroxymethylbilane synthase
MAEAAFEIVVIKTSGDRILDRPLAEIGGKGLFTKEIEEALFDRSIDLAVHSMKDVATRLPDGLVMAAILEREDPRDAFISLAHRSLDALPAGAVVGTSSLRRQAQVLARRPDLRVIGFRGNVQTRLKKLADGEAAATFLALAGLNRLGMADRATDVIPVEVMTPAVAQGAIGIECRADDAKANALVQCLDHRPTHVAVVCERAFLGRLDGSCRTPIAGHAQIDGDRLSFSGEILLPDGSRRHGASRRGSVTDAGALGDDAGREVLAAAGPDFLKGV